MSNLRSALATFLLTCTTACLETTVTVNEDYCGQHDGDAYCLGLDPGTPYCVLSTEPCLEASGLDLSTQYACVAERPAAECRQECGIGKNGCEDPTASDGSSSTGGETEDPSTTTEPDTDTEAETTTGPECTGNEECMDPALPFCVAEVCSPCSAVVDGTPDEACAALDEAAPLCIDDGCVQCTPESFEACGGTTPLCGDDNTCVGCSFHEECQDIGLHACNIATGACFSADAADVSQVNLAGANALQNAINAVADGAEHTILVTGSAATNHAATIDGGKTIAIVSEDASIQTVSGATSPIITVTGAGSTVYLHRLRIDGSNSVGISVGTAGTLYADSTQVSGNDGGGISLATGSSGFLRNCMVAGDGGNSSAISSSGDLEVLFSTLGRDTNFGDPVLECSGGSATVRNSLIVNQTNTTGDEVSCPGVSLISTPVESTTSPSDWFGSGFASGDYFLNAAGQAMFGDMATWEDGDPPFDFDGDDRPATNGATDYPGADVP